MRRGGIILKDQILNTVKNTTTIKTLHKHYKEGIKRIGVYNCEDSVKSLIMAALSHDKRNHLFICPNEMKARQYTEFINSISKDKAFYLPPEPYHFLFLENRSSEISDERLVVLNEMAHKRGKLIVTTPESLMKKMMTKEAFKKSRISFKVEERIEVESFLETLEALGYERVEQVEKSGEFAARGGIVDIFDPVNPRPFRVEFFDDEIDSIRIFDVQDQKSVEKVEGMRITPAGEIFFPKEIKDKLAKDCVEFMEEYLKKALHDKESKANFRELMEKIKTGTYKNIQSIIPWHEEVLTDLTGWFHKEDRIYLDDAGSFAEIIDEIRSRTEEEFSNLLGKGEAIPKSIEVLHKPDEVMKILEGFKSIEFQKLHKSFGRFPVDVEIDASSREIYSFYGKIGALADQITDWFAKDYHVYVTYETKDQLDALKEMLNGYQIGFSTSQKDFEPDHGSVNMLRSSIKTGFELYNDKSVWLTYSEIFKKETRKKKAKRKKGKKIETFTQLKLGDYIVHDTHGIGVYMGIEQIPIEGIKKDFLHLKYAKGDKLYIPVDQMEAIQVYMSFGDKEPKLNRLDSQEWKKVKGNAKKSVEELARELMEIYATRMSVKGHRYPGDNEWIKEFEEKFPYEETEDQLKAISDVKRDMESDTPMDRLICGDVGYGKTEVAIRAAFKAVMDSKQVAVLVPTTVLAQQHFNNFVQRFSDYPIRIEMLSRFRTKTQQEQIIKDIRKKRVDIVIGTHRLLSKDVVVDDLGLLVIDEEQRFGVKHKEKIKALKSNIDVMTLTATPIPRTLHMSLIGARDMSIIDEPPHNRTPVQTYVMEYNEVIIKDAVEREIARGGQVYYVYNRVKGIEGIGSKISEMVPKARVEVAHGQMGETKLENVMMDFIDHEFDVLVCTTIIESGLDIGRANTMIIENADQMGLSQLYQLRGRVGRSDRLSFAYITYKKDKTLNEVAEKRLKAIKDFTDFGSGFKIAMRDLEIRGAGNILGPQQSGHLLSVGYDMYCRLLEDAVSQLKGETREVKVQTAVELKADAYIPGSYIKSEKQKYELYKKIAGIDSIRDMDEIQEEVIDRYGDIPYSVMNLMNIALVKNTASALGIISIKEISDNIKVVFDEDHYLSPMEIKEIIKTDKLKFNPGEIQMTLMLKSMKDGRKNIAMIGNLLNKIQRLKNGAHPI
ncbi:transcription-repair coupling factor (superfamily II helicase) [Alkalibacter saccharofermentans DSM 14828]|uniref:Transcription-repair-coupling factor n=1 Tax=Alkalibacter saccharofermentans DSM 14828 TaxID=1120975 RepID=A0A1M4YCP9_9FIRM|nr:transcription-repair coupling factor (superfamily II helicase) [Alkalibacter saccharofermentans DSM 14828]